MILTRLGAGRVGEVWKERDTLLNRIVAFKRPSRGHAKGFDLDARHRRSDPLAYQPDFDIGTDYLGQEIVAGVPPRGPFAAQDAPQLAVQRAEAIEAAHDCVLLQQSTVRPSTLT
jgi:hypothetical protein